MNTELQGPAGVFGVLLLEIALGSLGILWVTPVWGVVKRGFFLLAGFTALACALCAQLALAGPLGRVGDAGTAPVALTAFTVLSGAFTAALLAKRLPVARVLGMLGVPAGVWAVLALALLRGDGGTAAKGAVAMLTGAAFLGATWVGMLLGHWYLVDRKLTSRPMKAYSVAYTAGVGLALVSALLAKGGAVSRDEAGFNPLLYVSDLTLYLAVGLVAICALLAFFVHKLVDEGSIRAATGMLYLAVILAFSAELAAKARFFTV